MVSAIGDMDFGFSRVGHKLGCLGCRQLLTSREVMEKVSDTVCGNFRMVKDAQHGDLWVMGEKNRARPMERPLSTQSTSSLKAAMTAAGQVSLEKDGRPEMLDSAVGRCCRWR